MAKRKRESDQSDRKEVEEQPRKAVKSDVEAAPSTGAGSLTIQVVTGSYERVLHGFTATLPAKPSLVKGSKSDNSKESSVQFADTFLFQAHRSAIRALAVSPLTEADSAQPQKLILASGGTDERVNLYSLSAAPPVVDERFPSVPTLAGNKILENPGNRELGSLLHHSSTITKLYFPTKSKLLAASEDNTISVVRTRDWTVVSTIKAPRPKPHGRPSGDTAPPGQGPAGVNDFAVHPSMKLMISVGRGEKCMRLWNLVTGKKAGALNFSKDLLQSVKEGRHGTGEGRAIVWNSEGEEFAVAFEWGVAVFGVDSVAKCRAVTSRPTKVHRIRYVTFRSEGKKHEFLAVSTEDGRVLFYSTQSPRKSKDTDPESSIPDAELYAQVGGKAGGVSGRVKDFEILSLASNEAWKDHYLLVTCGSDGVVRLWLLRAEDFRAASKPESSDSQGETRQIGTLLDTYETGDRITCMVAFVMQQPREPSVDEELEFESEAGVDDESSSDDEDSD